MATEKKYIIDLDKIETGDILLIISNRRLSEAMQRATGCKYHHALMNVGDSSYIHSYELGVQAGNMARRTFELEDDAIALRLKHKTADTIAAATNIVRAKIGTQYSMDELKRVLGAGDMDAEEANRQICTRLVAQAYHAAGVELVANADYCTLQELMTSEKVNIITDILRVGREKELAYANEKSAALSKQEEIHNSIFQQARELVKEDIQTFEQLENYVVANPKFDEQITAIIKDSGFLDLWKGEMDKNPQNYSFEAFEQYYPSGQWRETAAAYKAISSKNLRNYPFVMFMNKQSFEKHGLQYHQIHIELMKNLIEQFKQMDQTMDEALYRS